MTTSDTPGKTPQEILADLAWLVDAQASQRQSAELKGKSLKVADIYAGSIAEALLQLHALIRGEVIGEAVSDTLDMFVEGYCIGQNYLIADQHKRSIRNRGRAR